MRYNARDADTHYRRRRDKIGYFYGGHLNQLVDATPQQCGNAAYKPFPELEKLCLAVSAFSGRPHALDQAVDASRT